MRGVKLFNCKNLFKMKKKIFLFSLLAILMLSVLPSTVESSIAQEPQEPSPVIESKGYQAWWGGFYCMGLGSIRCYYPNPEFQQAP